MSALTAASTAGETRAAPVLTCSISPQHGKLVAARDIELEVGAGEIVAVIGPNGAGKSSTAECLAGRVRGPGPVILDGRAIQRLPAHARIRRGLALVPENRGLFPGLTVEENLALGAGASGRRSGGYDDIFDLFPVLTSRLRQKAGTLSGGEQEMLAIGRAIVGRPRVLILDEPTQGLAPVVLDHIVTALDELRTRRMAILLIEQNVGFVARVADRYSVISGGRVVATSATRAGLDDPAGLFRTFVAG